MHHIGLYGSVETVCLGKIFSQVIYKKALDQTGCRIFKYLKAQKL